jgi:four helix bundle protein
MDTSNSFSWGALRHYKWLTAGKRGEAMGLQNFEDLIVWQKSMDLVEEVYRIAKLLPKDEMYGLSSQMKRAAVSIPANIAEGQERSTSKDFVKLLYIAKGSKGELLTLLSLCARLEFLPASETEAARNLLAEVGKMLNSIIQKLAGL